MEARADLRTFSAFVLELYERSQVLDPVDLLHWSIESLGVTTACDANWGGWADLSRDAIEICGSVSRNLPPDFVKFWSDIKHEDLLARDFIETGCAYPTYNRQGTRHTEGMVALSDRYNIDKFSTIVVDNKRLPVMLFLSCYRSGRSARTLAENELRFLRAALDHVELAVERKALGGPDGKHLLVNESGRVLAASPETLRALRDVWPGWKGDRLPARPPRHSSRQIVSIEKVRFEIQLASQLADPHLYYIRLLGKDPCDNLTLRERQIVTHIADGLTHKEIARHLGISPATVRNHTQAVLTKLGARNKAALLKLIHSAAAG
ncbi:helix-turn-helix transcriptional regulator [Bradyrhizobium sp. 81013]|nr:helix-turn-helix transcriptional regulator [Bradyrhizobium aeschynomenes]